MQPHSIDIVCYYTDFGNPYEPLMERMTRSAREAMPYARTVVITPTPHLKFTRYFDKVVDVSETVPVSANTLCYERARSTVSWQAISTVPTAYVDPDIEFRKPIPFSDEFEVGVLWRKRKPDQPVNTGVVMAMPGCPEFWARYGAIVANLPLKIRGWWCDQLAFSVLLGVLHEPGETIMAKDARVKLLDWTVNCCPEEKCPDEIARGKLWAVHMKGQRKWQSLAA